MYPYIYLYLYFYVHFQFSLMPLILKQNHRVQTSFSVSTFVTSYAISKKLAPHNSHYIVSLFNRSPMCNPFLIAVVTCYSQQFPFSFYFLYLVETCSTLKTQIKWHHLYKISLAGFVMFCFGLALPCADFYHVLYTMYLFT